MSEFEKDCMAAEVLKSRFQADMRLYADIETILQQHNVKCSDWIGLVEKLHALSRTVLP